VLQGGRYDTLLGRYGRPWPAVGFAVDVEATAGALESATAPPLPAGESNGVPGGVLISGPAREAERYADQLRAQGRRAAVDYGGLKGAALDAYARRWQFSEVVRLGARRAATSRVATRQPKAR
jgi:ATP phosphoribosyltransferase regulatory subunit